MKSIFVHHVFFWLHEPQNPEARKTFEKGLQGLLKIEEIQEYHLGIPAETDREVVDNSYTYSLLLIIRDKADHDSYQKHPIHLRFIDECGKLWKRIQVYDSVDMGKKP